MGFFNEQRLRVDRNMNSDPCDHPFATQLGSIPVRAARIARNALPRLASDRNQLRKPSDSLTARDRVPPLGWALQSLSAAASFAAGSPSAGPASTDLQSSTQTS